MKVLTAACVLTLFAASPALGQQLSMAPPAQRFFVTGALLADRDYDFTQTTTSTLGVAMGIGTFLRPHVGLSFETEIPQRHRHTWERPFDYEDLVSGAVVRGPVVSQTAIRTSTYAGLVGFHVDASQRLRLAFLAGLGMTVESERISNVQQGTGREVSGGSLLDGAPTISLGADGQIRLTSRLAIAPQLRTHVEFAPPYFGKVLFRPRVALVWRF